MIKLKRFFSGRKYFFAVLSAILLYEWVVVGRLQPWKADVVAYEFHALDFSLGFGSFILPGDIYQRICGAVNEKSLTVYSTVLLLVFFVCLALFLEKLVLSVDKKDRRAALTLIFLFLTGPSTFSIFVTDIGMPEVYWVYLAAIFFLFLAYEPLNLLIAPLCVLALLVNYAAIICYVPFFCILLLYKYSVEESKSAKRILMASFILCVCVSIPFYIYIALGTMKNMTLTFEEYNALMRSRGVTELTYTDSLFYGRYEEDYPADFYAKMAANPFYTEGGSLTRLQKLVNFAVFRLNMVGFHFSQRSPLMLLVPFLAILPVAALIFRFCLREIKKKDNMKLRRFVFLCMIALPVLSIAVSWPLSFDFFKWMSFAFLPLFASFLYVLYRESGYVIDYIRSAVKAFSFPQIVLYCSVYAVCVLSAYY
ncbi:MAG: hypothetical protein IJS90_10355 [Clostridia bacterium]|nr:hypothetical protein [Clostridia bacterium]